MNLNLKVQAIFLHYFTQRINDFPQVHVSGNCYVCCWFDITVDISPNLLSSLDQKGEKKQTFYQSDKTMIHHEPWLQKYVIRFNLS